MHGFCETRIDKSEINEIETNTTDLRNSVLSLDSWLFPVNGIVGNVVGCGDESASKLQSVPSAFGMS